MAIKIIFLSIACAGVVGLCRAATPSLPAAEQEVVQAFLGQEDALGTEVAVFEIASAAKLDFNGSYQQVQKATHREIPDRGHAFVEAVEDMLKRSQTAGRITEITNAHRRVQLIAQDAFKSIFLENDAAYDDWTLFYDRFPNCGRIVALSRVGFDQRATTAVLCYAMKEPERPGITRFGVLRRAGGRWLISESRRVMRSKGTNTVNIRCELRYYVAHYYPEGTSQELALQVVQNQRTNLVCSVPRGFRVVTNNGLDFAGWILQVVEPAELAGQPLTAIPDDYPSEGFRFGRLYDIAVPKDLIGDLRFRIRFE